TSIGSFRFTSSRDSEVILLSRRLALKYNTIRRAGCQHFLQLFSGFFVLTQIRFILLYSSGKVFCLL
ncbi:hypothetical protein, partial [Faecalibacterium prausnitzii]|uniref:hypothetical protein n=1 Tax=Faecalibacterium prausnitzii TaxID=853 RepID=UPI00130DB230